MPLTKIADFLRAGVEVTILLAGESSAHLSRYESYQPARCSRLFGQPEGTARTRRTPHALLQKGPFGGLHFAWYPHVEAALRRRVILPAFQRV